MNARQSYAVATGADPVTDETPKVWVIMKRLLAGEKLDAVTLAEEGYTNHMIHHAVQGLTRWGHTFTKTERPTSSGAGRRIVEYTIENPEHRQDDPAPHRASVIRAQAREAITTAKSRKAARGSAPAKRIPQFPTPLHPSLGATLQVTVLALTDDGGLQLGLTSADGEHYLTRVIGSTVAV